MFETVTEGLGRAFRRMLGRDRLTEANVAEAVEDVRMALLEADVDLGVVQGFVDRVREKALGAGVAAGVDPGQQFVKIVHDGLASLLGGRRAELRRAVSGPTVIMLCGLQGTGKTTTAGKLAARLLREGRSPLLVAADMQRPAAVEQLRVLGEAAGVPVHWRAGGRPVDICRQAVQAARLGGQDTVILDTAGRLAVDDALMGELGQIALAAAPHEILYVCDAMIGQSAVGTAREFGRRLALTGAVMTKLDSDARGGAALSLLETAGVPIKYVATGEKPGDLEEFHPDRMASRILGMGDVVSLVEKAQAVVDQKEAARLQERLAANSFTLEDFLRQMGNLRRMGGIKDVLKLVPGMGAALGGADAEKLDEGPFRGFEAIIQSMTVRERRQPEIIDTRRRVRIARGSGRPVKDVSDLLRQFAEMRRMMGRMGKLGMFGGGGAEAMRALASGRAGELAGGRSLHGSKKAGTRAQRKKKKDRKKKRRK